MRIHEREFLISRIAAGYLVYRVGNERLKIHYPNRDIVYEGNIVYQDSYEEALDAGCITKYEAREILMDYGIWTPQKEKEYKEIVPKQVEYFKEELYKSRYKSDQKKKIRLYLETAKKHIIDLADIRSTLDHLTCEGIATYSKWFFIIGENGVNYNKFPSISPTEIMSYYYANIIEDNEIRELAHTAPWETQWAVSKKESSIFGRCGADLTLDQQRLMMWSGLYDSINESSEPPAQEIIDDDDMLDGWLIVKRKERKQNLSEAEKNRLYSDKVGKADEVYIPVDTMEDAEAIYAMNNARGNSIRRQRLQALNKHGKMNETEFMDTRQKHAQAVVQEQQRRLRSR